MMDLFDAKYIRSVIVRELSLSTYDLWDIQIATHIFTEIFIHIICLKI